jgi:SPP1 gp7 family putative phage head morphogenesis protein
MFEYSEEQIQTLLYRIFSGDVTPYDLPASLYYAIADYLKRGLYKGYGGSLNDFDPSTADYALLDELRDNIYMFSAAKTFQQVRDMTDALVDENDEIRSFSEFKDIAGDIFDQYNENWLEAEYDTAIGQAQNAVRWQEIEKNKDVLPILRYSAVGDDNTCEICAPLDGVTLPVDDDFWNEFMPSNHFRCRCGVEQLDDSAEEEVTGDDEAEELGDKVRQEMAPEFLMNPGKDHVIFNDEHPYFDIAPKDKGFAEENFGLPIPDND